MVTQVDLPNRIREIRQRKKIKPPELARLLSITPKHLYDLETGKRRLHDDIIVKVCEIYGVTSDYLLGISNVMEIKQDEDYAIGFMKEGDINVKALKQIINQAVEEMLAERNRDGDGDDGKTPENHPKRRNSS
jgi:transcriptional regulator with XRE-family HTH domain